jgi:thiol-disulfide isomerase/thioredoxin
MYAMKLAGKYIIFLFICVCSCKTVKYTTEPGAGEISGNITALKEIDFHEQATWLLGFINPVQMAQYPHSEWYLKGYNDYSVKQEFIQMIQASLDPDVRITVVLGTWCPDSHREVPRFMRILKEVNFPGGYITLIGVDMNKLSPIGDFEKLDIQRVPTFIFYKKNIEAGRIIENPVTSLEQDIINILKGNN